MTNRDQDETLREALQRGATFRCRLIGDGIQRTLNVSLRDGNAEIGWSVPVAPGADLANAMLRLFDGALQNLARASDAPSVAAGRAARPLPNAPAAGAVTED